MYVAALLATAEMADGDGRRRLRRQDARGMGEAGAAYINDELYNGR